MKKIILTFTAFLAISAISLAQPVADFTGSPTTICAGQSVSWTNNSQNATTYTWSFPGSTQPVATVQNPANRTYNVPGVYDVRLIADAGGGNRDTLLKVNYITVLASPTVTITPGVGAPNGYAYVGCSITSVTLTAAGASTYTWAPATALSSTSGATVVASPTTNTTYTVTGTNAAGCTARSIIIVEYNTAPPPDSGPLSGPTMVCSGQKGVAYINPPVNTSFTPYRDWTVPSDAVIVSGQGTRNNFKVDFGTTSGTICCTLKNACGASTPACITVTVSPTPAVDTVGVITGPANVCANQSGITFSVSPVANATSYTWTLPAGAVITAGQNTNAITVTFSTISGNICVRAGNSCNVTPQVCKAVTVSPATPAIPGTITGPASVCNGQAGVVYSVPPVGGPPINYSWTIPAGATITAGQGTRTITLTYGSTSGDICVTAGNACGVSMSRCVTVTVSPTPAVGTVGSISGPSAVCANQSGITYSISAVTNATNYTWNVPNGSVITAGQGTTTIVVSFSTTPGNVCVRAGNSCSITQQVCQAVTVAPNAPAIPGAITGPATVCSGQSGVVYSVPIVGGPSPTYSWTVPSGSSITAGQGTRTVTITFGSTTGDICVTAGNACGTSLPKCQTVTVSPSPAVDTVGVITGPAAVCANQSGISYSISPVTNATSYTWTVPGGAVINSGQNTNSITVTFTNTPGNVCVMAGNSCSISQQKCMAVSVSPAAPSIPSTITGPGNVCNGASGVTYSVPLVAGNPTYSWTVPSGTVITGGQGSRTVTVTFGGTSGDICVTAANACGTSLPRCMTLTVNPASAVDTVGAISGPVGICANQSGVVYSVPAVPNATSYTWTVPNGAIITAGANTNSITVTFSTTPGSICVTAGNSCNNTQQRCLTVTVSPNTPSIPGTITGLTNVCSGQSAASYSIAAVANATSYSWTVPSGSNITAGQGTRFLTITFGNTSGDVCVDASNACGTSLPKCLTVTVNPTPAVDSVGVITGPVAACANQGGVMYSIDAVANATTYTWTVPNGVVINSGQGTTSISVTFSTAGGSICVTASNSCNSSQPKCMNVSVAPNAPGIPGTISGNNTVCEGEQVTYSIASVPNASSYLWTAPAGSSIDTGQGTTAVTVTFGNTSGDICVTAGNGCGNSLPKCLTLTVTTLPIVDVSPAATTICPNGSVFLTASGATTYAWSPAAGLSSTTGATVTASPVNTTVYTVSGTALGCANTAVATITVSICTGIVASENNSDIHVYPNPANDNLFVEGTFAPGKVRLNLISMPGQKLMSREVEVNGKMSEKVSVGDLPAGIYFIEIRSEETTTQIRFIKQ